MHRKMGSIMSSMSNQVLSIIEKKNGQNNYFEEEITIEERSKYLFLHCNMMSLFGYASRVFSVALICLAITFTLSVDYNCKYFI